MIVKKNRMHRIEVSFRVNGVGLRKPERLRWSAGGSKEKIESIIVPLDNKRTELTKTCIDKSKNWNLHLKLLARTESTYNRKKVDTNVKAFKSAMK